MKVLIFAVLVAVTAAQNTTEQQPECQDDPVSQCWSKPDSDCVGIYEPWSRVHCGLRCGYCGTPPCKDELSYCDRFELATCSSPDYQVWARTNCRQFCNKCYNPGTSNITEGTTTPGAIVTPQNQTVVIPPVATTTTITTNRVARGTLRTFVLIDEHAGNTDNCTYKGLQYPPQSRWNDGCEYECACMEPRTNRVVCQERCTRWEIIRENVGNCSIVAEEGECCNRLECQ